MDQLNPQEIGLRVIHEFEAIDVQACRNNFMRYQIEAFRLPILWGLHEIFVAIETTIARENGNRLSYAYRSAVALRHRWEHWSHPSQNVDTVNRDRMKRLEGVDHVLTVELYISVFQSLVSCTMRDSSGRRIVFR